MPECVNIINFIDQIKKKLGAEQKSRSQAYFEVDIRRGGWGKTERTNVHIDVSGDLLVTTCNVGIPHFNTTRVK